MTAFADQPAGIKKSSCGGDEFAPPNTTGLEAVPITVGKMTDPNAPLNSVPFKWIDDRLKQLIYRTLLAISLLIGSGAAGYFFTLDKRITAIEQDRAARNVRQDAAALVLNGNVATLVKRVDGLSDKVDTVSDDVLVMKGILQEMQRSHAASLTSPNQLAEYQ
jgi:hypothetical protein